MTRFPSVWLDLLVAHSTLGERAPEILATIEARIAARESCGVTVFPRMAERYRALAAVAPDRAHVLLSGQDAYHGTVRLPDGRVVPEATGLCFSVPKGARLPPSLRNIWKEMAADLGGPVPTQGDLAHWSDQGVVMLNSILTVEQDQPKSHDKYGWQTITAAIIEALSKTRPGLVFILWGNSAKALREYIQPNGHTLIESSHPSPIGGACYKGFFGSQPSSRTNAALLAQGKPAIVWEPPLTTGSTGALF
ncbi:MAG: uracil-DNA glycosylase [Acidocella sp.]|nr:uracil-DNA glycosylase [Acidocella sp.]